jgi:hypothetical protein
MIVDTRKKLISGSAIDLADLVCCQQKGPQMGGLMPLPTNAPTECETGTPVPLASLAATNTRNAQAYLVAYTSASYGSSTIGDYIPTNTPYCLWAYTASGVAMMNVTVAAAQIVTLSSSSYLMGTIGSGSQSSSRTMSPTGSSSTSTKASTGSRVALKNLWVLGILCAGLGILPQYP